MEKAFGSKSKMAPTLIMKCPNCNGLMLTSTIQKTKTCPYCSKQVNLKTAQKIAQANTAMEASELLKQLKANQGFSLQ
jgi:acetyl-CoA carboxylase beta subunit